MASKYGRALTGEEVKNYAKADTIRVGNTIFLRKGVADYTPPAPQDLLSVYKQAFGDAAGQAFYDSLQAPVPLSNDQLVSDFNTQFNPYFQDLQNQYGQDFATQTQRAQEDFNYNTQNFEQQALRANQNAIGGYNDQFGDAYGSQMQLTKEAQRQEALKRQRDQMQQGFQRRNYDLNQLNTQRLKDLENSRQTAQGDYANNYRYSNVV